MGVIRLLNFAGTVFLLGQLERAAEPTSGVLQGCLRAADFLQFGRCARRFYRGKATLGYDQWSRMLPTGEERLAYSALIFEVLRTGECDDSMLAGSGLAGQIRLSTFLRRHCVIHEAQLDAAGKFRRSMPIVVLNMFANGGALPAGHSGYSADLPHRYERPAEAQSGDDAQPYYMHHSAAHYESDGAVDLQAFAVYGGTAANSIVVATARRDACVERKSACQPRYWPVDAAHNNDTFYFAANVAVWQYALAAGACPRCAFVEWHGKARSCKNITAFISAGLRRRSGVYERDELPANMLVSSIKREWKSSGANHTVFTPAGDPCFLRATKNCFGRVINGYDMANVCGGPERYTGTGFFVHVETSAILREQAQFPAWVSIVNRAFRRTHDA